MSRHKHMQVVEVAGALLGIRRTADDEGPNALVYRVGPTKAISLQRRAGGRLRCG